MTSNSEEQATTQPVAPAQPPKTTKRATVPPRKPRVAPSKPKSGKKASPADARAQSQKGAKRAKTASAREGSKTAKVLDLLKRSGGVTLKELTKATGLAAAFGPRLSVRHRTKEDEADGRLRQRCGQ